MELSEMRGLSDKDLETALVDAKQELWKIRFDLATRQEKNYSRLPATRKQIARILTVMTERQAAAAADGAGGAAAAGDATASSAAGTAATATAGAPSRTRKRSGRR